MDANPEHEHGKNSTMRRLMRRLRIHNSRAYDVTTPKRLYTKKPIMRERLLAEFVGTFFLVLTVSVAVAGKGTLAAVAIGVVLSVQIYTFGAVSGGFFNPAVTLAVLLSGRGKISARDAALYMVAQSLGGIFAGLAGLSATESSFYFHPTRNYWTSFQLEAFYTMALCGTVLAAGTSNDAPNHYFGFAIGLTVTGGALACGGCDQGSFNPAVTLGINIANQANSASQGVATFEDWALFIVSPLLGAVLAAGVFRGTRGNEFLRSDDDSSSDSEEA